MGCFSSKLSSPRSSHAARSHAGTFESNPLPAAGSSYGGAIQHETLSPRAGSSSDASSVALRGALPSSSSAAASGVGLQGNQYVLKNGNVFPSINSLPTQERAAFLAQHDPVCQRGLDNASVFFRAVERERIVDGALTGHPQAGALIRNHLALAPNPYMPGKFVPAEMRATQLPDPVLNVIHGPDALQAAMNYATDEGRVPVMMTLGDLRGAGGGEVFLDVTARYGQDDAARALIVTLPAGKEVPVTVLD